MQTKSVNPHPDEKDARTFGRQDIALLLVVFGVAALLRFAALGSEPPGLYYDEAANGLDALGVLEGNTPLYFAANNGREPLYIYLAALSVQVFGPTAFALRLPAAMLGALTVPATYALGRAWFDRRVGLMAAAVLAVTLWHVHLSRVAFRVVALPLLLAMALAAGAHGLKTGRRWTWIAAGVAYGLSFYTYLPARFTPLALLLVGAAALAWHREALLAHWRALAFMAFAAAIVAAPLGVLALQDPDLVFGRSDQVAVWNPAIHGGDLPDALVKHALGALGMFAFRGDAITRHNPPGRPVFDPLLALAWGVGVVWLARRGQRRNLAALAVVLWIAVLLLPTALAEDSPHFLRAAGVLPVAVLPAAYVLAKLPRAAAVALLAVSLGITVYQYFGVYLPAEDTALAFDYAAAALAGEVNASAQAVVDWRIWERYPQVEYLTADHPAVYVYYDDRPPPALEPGPALLAAWPYEPQERLTRLAPEPAQLEVTLGPTATYGPGADPFHLYAAYQVRSAPAEADTPLATFEDGMALVGVGGTCEDFTLRWQATGLPGAAYTAMIHLGDQAYDAPPGTWVYPTDHWRPGDVVVQRVHAAAPCDDMPLVLGLYNGGTGERLPIVDTRLPPASTRDDTVQFTFN